MHIGLYSSLGNRLVLQKMVVINSVHVACKGDASEYIYYNNTTIIEAIYMTNTKLTGLIVMSFALLT